MNDSSKNERLAKIYVQTHMRFALGINNPTELLKYNAVYYPAFKTIIDESEILSYYIECNKTIYEYLELALTTFMENAKSPSEPDEKEPSFQLDVIKTCLEECARRVIDWMEICYPSHYCTVNNLLSGQGYLQLLRCVSKYYSNEANINSKLQQQANLNTAQATRVANSKVTGLGFGIISNSIISHLIYNSQNEAEIKRQTKEAETYLLKAKTQISLNMKRQLQIANRNYYNTFFIPQMIEAIKNTFREIAILSLISLEKQCGVNISFIKQIDFEKSQMILKRIDNSPNPDEIIALALLSCPYNIDIYIEAKKRNMCEFFLDNLIDSFSLTEQINAKMKQ